jgi:hypothetical protein
MSLYGWLNENEGRAYPFLQGRDLLLDPGGGLDSAPLPDEVIVDFGCITGTGIGRPAIYLGSIHRTGDVLTVEMRGDSGLAGLALRFTRALADPEYTTTAAAAVQTVDGAPPPGACADALIWEGWLTTGRLEGLAAMLADGQTLTAHDTSIRVEPTTIQVLDAGVTSVNLANVVRPTVTAPDECPPAPDPAHPAGVAVAGETCITGAIALVDGHNVAIRQSARENAITLGAQPGAGAGPPCGEVLAYPGETPPEGSSLLTGGPACDELVRSINGSASSAVRLIGGRGVRVAADPDDPHAVIVDVDLHDLARC